ncbi:hypothetical protein [uncultured Psychroserpens sp.]|uniref:hypothetical protein n=1 Tax=uncultured Psychroserpens sp. TaxID=255436 RepID=UPI00262668AC|nr:hypothetical protein [uncultured Psychroserpens sp.]
MTGTLCGLTGKKPDFQDKCGVIKLESEFKEQIEKVNIEYESVLKTKTDTIGHIIMYSVIALALFIGGFLIGKYVFDRGVISTVPLIIMGIGLGPLAIAFAPLNKYLTDLKIAKKKKDTLDTLCGKYGYHYDINIVHHTDSLGNKSYDTKLNIRKTSNTY